MSQTALTIVRYQASAPEAQYMGSNLTGFIDNLNADITRPILEKFNVTQIDPGEWMSAQLQLDMLREIEEKCTFEELVAIGVKAGEVVPLPPDVDSVEKVIALSPVMQQMVVRNASPDERIHVERMSPNHFRVILNLPLPPFTIYGYMYGMLRRVAQPGETPIITITDRGTPYIFEIKW